MEQYIGQRIAYQGLDGVEFGTIVRTSDRWATVGNDRVWVQWDGSEHVSSLRFGEFVFVNEA